MKKLKMLMALAGLMVGASVGTAAGDVWVCEAGSCISWCDNTHCYWYCTRCRPLANIYMDIGF